MTEMDIRQYRTSAEEFLGLKNLHPQGRYKICVGEGPRTTWFSFIVPINNMEVDFTWHLDWDVNEDKWTEVCVELELI